MSSYLADPLNTPTKSSGNFIHIAQMHATPGLSRFLDPYDYFLTAVSEWGVAMEIQNLQKRSPIALFSEGEYEEQKQENLDRRVSCLAKQAFPKGIPERFADLSVDQQDALVNIGAAKVLFNLGLIGNVYPTITEAKSKEVYKHFNSLGGDAVAGHILAPIREKACVEQLQRFTKDSTKTPVFIFGAGHDFSPYFEEGSFTRVETELTAPPPRKAPEEESRES